MNLEASGLTQEELEKQMIDSIKNGGSSFED